MIDFFLAAIIMSIALAVFSTLFPKQLVPWAAQNKRLKGFLAYLGLSVASFIALAVTLESQPDASQTRHASVNMEASAETMPTKPAMEWLKATGNIWTGVKLFYGPKKMEVGIVIGGNDNYISPTGGTFRGVKVRMKSGSEEWKNRDAMIAGDWYVRADDPAIERSEWEFLSR